MKSARTICLPLFAIVLSSISGFSQSSSGNEEALVFRQPFTLKLKVDKDHYYEEHYDRKIPYVAKNDVYLFSGENFGINVVVAGDEIKQVIYQPDLKKADIELKFTQEENKGKAMMILVIRNRLMRRVYLSALMTIPEKKEIYNTTILPVEPGLSGYESWPHPIVQLVLRDFRFSEKPAGKPEQGR